MTVPIGKAFKSEGVNATLAVLALWDDRMTLHITLQPCPATFLEEWLRGTREIWRAEDDLGTQYETAGIHSRGNEQGCVVLIDWRPAPPPHAASVTLEAQVDGEVVVAHRTSLHPLR